jgi:hypothetical protein
METVLLRDSVWSEMRVTQLRTATSIWRVSCKSFESSRFAARVSAPSHSPQASAWGYGARPLLRNRFNGFARCANPTPMKLWQGAWLARNS